MSENPEQPRPARPLAGYRDIGGEEERYARPAVIRSWLILAVIILCYFAWTLIVYFFEPGLR